MTLEAVEKRERELFESAGRDLPALTLASITCRLLADLIPRVRNNATSDDRSPGELRVHALWFMTILGFRSLRAAMNCIAIGYEDQSVGHQRLIDELRNRAVQVRRDESGNIAKLWLQGIPTGSASKLAGQEHWELLSGPVHANSRAVFDWIAITQDDENASIQVGPERRPEIANATLTMMAGEVRDLAEILTAEAGIKVDLEELDASIVAAQKRFIPDTDERPSP